MSVCKFKTSFIMHTIDQILIAEKSIRYFPSNFIGIDLSTNHSVEFTGSNSESS